MNKIIVIFLCIFIYLLNSNLANSRESIPMNQLTEVTINGTKQWIYVTGSKNDNPILLVLHGGPGFAMLPLLHENTRELENYFTIVNWDQRGAGLSYSEDVPRESMTVKQLVDDAHVLTKFLQQTYHTKKIYILGHSFGTIVGVLLAKNYPEDYFAYIGIGQVVNFAENETGSYDFALQSAAETKNLKALNELNLIGRPDSKGNYQSDDGYEITEKWVEFFGGSLFQKNNIEAIYDQIFDNDVYKNYQKQILKGYEFSQSLFDDNESRSFNLCDEASSIIIPVYFLSGKYDYETPYDLVKNCFESLPILNKEFIEFSKSAHFPFYEEPEKFVSVMKKILADTQSNQKT
jgi:proline iminopeptidase